MPTMPSVTVLRDRVRGWFHREPKVVAPPAILIVDGSQSNRQHTARLVESLGYEPLQAAGIGDALTSLEEHPAEFVLLSFDLADASGMDALSQLRTNAADLPVIMLAHDLWDARTAEAMRLGAVAYLAKPFGPDDLREVLGRG